MVRYVVDLVKRWAVSSYSFLHLHQFLSQVFITFKINKHAFFSGLNSYFTNNKWMDECSKKQMSWCVKLTAPSLEVGSFPSTSSVC